jgi:phospholipid/cholesterol/gamma-HCH transport system substrate-binding protein
MNESSNKRTVIVGVFILAGLALLAGGILIVGNLRETFKKKFSVVALFDDVNGLQPGNNVWYSGVKVGLVSSVQFYGKSQVKIMMKVEEKAQQYIRKDALVKISTDGLIGNKILVIYGGTSKAPQIQEGDTLGVEKTFTSEDMINTLQANNVNVLEITSDLKKISKSLVNGEGTLGKLLKDDRVYSGINATVASLQQASARAQELIASLNTYTAGFNRKGTLANELSTDTVVFNSLKRSVVKLQKVMDTAAVLVSDLKAAGKDPNSPIGVLLHDKETGARLKKTIKNLETGSATLNEDLEALQHNFLTRRYFRKKGKEEKDTVK